MKTTLNYYLQIADNALILSHRLAENTSKGPFLEEDLATTNVALDLIGLAESVLNEAAKLEGLGQTGDDLAYRREESEFMNCLLVEQPNRDFAHIVTRQFFMDTFNYHYFIALTESKDTFLSAIAFKSIKEVTYHLRRSSEWMIRLGTGTDESKPSRDPIKESNPFLHKRFKSLSLNKRECIKSVILYVMHLINIFHNLRIHRH